MSNLILECKDTGDFKPHPEGIHPAVCVDVMDLGLVETEFQGQKKMVNKVKLVFESEQKTEDGKNCTVFRNFTASLHSKARLAEFLGKWRGRPVLPGEKINLAQLLGASCTLVISHQQNLVGKTYASIDAVSKPTKKVVASGTYDPAATRQRYAEWVAKQAVPARNAPGGATSSGLRPPSPQSGEGGRPGGPSSAPQPSPGLRPDEPRPGNSPAPVSEGNKSVAPATAPAAAATADFDPEVGF